MYSLGTLAIQIILKTKIKKIKKSGKGDSRQAMKVAIHYGKYRRVKHLIPEWLLILAQTLTIDDKAMIKVMNSVHKLEFQVLKRTFL